MSCCDGKPISKLPKYVLPYLGSEEFAFVQQGMTKAGTLSSFLIYLSGDLVTRTELGNLSGGWQDAYDLVITDGGAIRWDSNYNLTNSLSDNWNSAYSTVFTYSADWSDDLNVVSEFGAASGSWENVKTVVQINSSAWAQTFDYTLIALVSSKWDSAYNTVNSLSDDWSRYADLINAIGGLSGEWDSAYTTVKNNSANWDSTYTTVRDNSCAWDDAFLMLACSDETSDISPGIVNTFRIPYDVDLVQVRADVGIAPVGSNIEIDIRSNGLSILTDLLYIDAGDKSSLTSATPPTLNGNANLLDDDEIEIEVNTVGSTTPGTGLKLTFIGNRKGCL